MESENYTTGALNPYYTLAILQSSTLKVFVRVNTIYEFMKVLEFCLGATEHKMKQKVAEVTDNIYSGLLTANTSVENKLM